MVSELDRQTYDCAFVDDGAEIDAIIYDAPVIGRTADLQTLFAEYQKLVAVGNNAVREHVCDMAKRIGYGFPNLVSSSAYITPYAKLGRGCVVLNNAVVQNGSTIGNGAVINPAWRFITTHWWATVR